jgi:hypothetical protein
MGRIKNGKIFHPEAGNPALKGGVFSKNGWGGVRIPSPTNQSRALRPGFQRRIAAISFSHPVHHYILLIFSKLPIKPF